MLRRTDAPSWTDPFRSSIPVWRTARNVPGGNADHLVPEPSGDIRRAERMRSGLGRRSSGRLWPTGCEHGSVASPYVNYDAAASRYAKARTPLETALSAWGAHVAPFLSGGGTALDLAAGTGGFSGALVKWGADAVVAVEPSEAMQTHAEGERVIRRVRGRAESIPLADGSVDFVWISTAFHHFAQPTVAVSECRRVLSESGTIVVRGFVPGHSSFRWLTFFPGFEKAVDRFPSLTIMEDLFAEAGFHLVRSALVQEGEQTWAERAAFSDRMLHSDSILTALSDEEVDAGVAALRAQADETETFALSLLAFAHS